MMPTTANSERFGTRELTDDAFMTWALRVMFKLKNTPPGASPGSVNWAMEDIPNPVRDSALLDMLLAARPKG